ncbi:MAG: DNA polymerase III subunit beta [Streptosporangiaceae bacterium]
MRLRVDRDAFADAVAWSARTLPSRPSVPVLAGMLLEVSGAGSDAHLRLSSFDYEVSTQTTIGVHAGEPDRLLVSGRLLAEITRNLPSQPVDMETDGTKLVLTCGSARFTLLTLPVEDYPSLPDMPPRSGLIAGDVFTTAVTQVAVAAGRDDTLPILTGVRLELEGEGITMAATDRYRLAVRDLSWKPERPDLSTEALVPARTLADTARALSPGTEVEVALSDSSAGEGMIGFEGGGRRTTTRLLEGEFVKYRSLLPSETATRVDVEIAPFVEAVKRVSLVAERGTPIRLAFSAGEIVLEAGTGDEAQAVEAVPATLEGDDVQIAFNPGFLLDGLNVLGSDAARLEFTTPTKPAMIIPTPADDSAGPDYRYILMPVRLSS